MMHDQCRICRRTGQKLFLKGERCYSPKCAMIKRAHPPGPERKKRSRAMSEYKKALTEKQKLKNFYGLSESQFAKYVSAILKRRAKIQDIASELIGVLESRLDSTVFNLGFAKSRIHARQLVNHGHFLVSGKAIDIPSYPVKKGDTINIKETKKGKKVFAELAETLKKKEPPSWLELNKATLTGKLKEAPKLADVQPVAEISIIFEFYSR